VLPEISVTLTSSPFGVLAVTPALSTAPTVTRAGNAEKTSWKRHIGCCAASLRHSARLTISTEVRAEVSAAAIGTTSGRTTVGKPARRCRP
jgi:hypothetical protein